MFASFATFTISEWLRFAFAILLTIPLIVFGLSLFGLYPNIICGMEGKRRKKPADERANENTGAEDAQNTQTRENE